jgi:DnaJ family protein C protein 3
VGLKQSAEAINACTQALAQDGGMIDAHFQRAEAHLLVDDYDKALHDFHKAREIQPQNQQANEGIHRVQRLQKMASRKDYYKILELTKTASDAEIRKAYRRLAKASPFHSRCSFVTFTEFI